LRIIKSSDDEEESNSDSSLDDLDQLISLAKPASSTAGPVTSSARSNRVDRNRVQQRSPTASVGPAAPQYKFSIASLVAQAEEDDASEARIAKAESVLRKDANQSLGTEPERNSRNGSVNEVDKSLLGTVLGRDEAQGGMQKVMHAMKRTEALSRPMTWYFFDPTYVVPPSCERGFPDYCLADSGWESLLGGNITDALYWSKGGLTPLRQILYPGR
jgi:hypothetical protein